jgi:hypothetical protein
VGIRQHYRDKGSEKIPLALGRNRWSVQQWRKVSKDLTGNIVILMASTLERQLNLFGISAEASEFAQPLGPQYHEMLVYIWQDYKHQLAPSN